METFVACRDIDKFVYLIKFLDDTSGICVSNLGDCGPCTEIHFVSNFIRHTHA